MSWLMDKIPPIPLEAKASASLSPFWAVMQLIQATGAAALVEQIGNNISLDNWHVILGVTLLSSLAISAAVEAKSLKEKNYCADTAANLTHIVTKSPVISGLTGATLGTIFSGPADGIGWASLVLQPESQYVLASLFLRTIIMSTASVGVHALILSGQLDRLSSVFQPNDHWSSRQIPREFEVFFPASPTSNLQTHYSV